MLPPPRPQPPQVQPLQVRRAPSPPFGTCSAQWASSPYPSIKDLPHPQFSRFYPPNDHYYQNDHTAKKRGFCEPDEDYNHRASIWREPCDDTVKPKRPRKFEEHAGVWRLVSGYDGEYEKRWRKWEDFVERHGQEYENWRFVEFIKGKTVRTTGGLRADLLER